jgi:hypothetical protein
VPREAINRLEFSTGQDSRPLHGMAIGAGVAGIAFTAFSLAYKCTANCHDTENTLFMTGTGALIGLGIGALTKTDRWNKVPQPNAQVGLQPTHGGVRGMISLRF